MLTDLGSTRRVITYCVVTVTSGWSLCIVQLGLWA